ncbi:MAG TPA: T9SS type A sorting domain-containing protein, partial [Panacibacter sp.]|nr:T9SS type A sorting domain-containing protein [Panacibacter sp.]
GMAIPDTVVFYNGVNTAYDTLQGYIVFKNISSVAFTPLKINMVLYDADNIPYSFGISRTKTLAPGDTVHIFFSVNITALPAGTYNLFLDINPGNDQPEQYHFNNYVYKYIVVQRETILPQRLLSFSATPLNTYVLLNWNIAGETNVSNYSVDFSRDAGLFHIIGNVPATASVVPVKKYSFIHKYPVAGKNYYRLKMIGKDGRFSYSPVCTAVFNNGAVTVYPNPVKDYLNITVNTENTVTSTVRLFDVTGRQLMQQNFNLTTLLNAGKLTPGIYIVQVNDGAQLHSFKVYKP